MTSPTPPPKKPFYISQKNWQYLEAQRIAHQQGTQAGQAPPVPPHIWSTLSPAEQAQIMAQYAGQQQIVRAQQQSSRRIVWAIVIVFVVLPAVIWFVLHAAAALSG